jgi:hypothetical protein
MLSEALIFVIKIQNMLHPIVEEVWTTDVAPKLARRVRIKDAKDGWEAAYQRAQELAAKFDESDFVHGRDYSYAWGRNRKSRKIHRFVIR